MWSIDEISQLIREVPDFPEPGVNFKDIAPILESPEAFISLARHFARMLSPDVTHLMAIESRGFILGAALAQHLNVSLVLVRKPGKLPPPTLKLEYELEYGQDAIEMHQGALSSNDHVAIIDDVLATGGTANATAQLCEKAGATVEGFYFLIEIEALKGRQKLFSPVHSFIQY